MVALLGDDFYEMILLHHIVNQEASWLYITIDLSPEVLIHSAEDPNLSVVVLASY